MKYFTKKSIQNNDRLLHMEQHTHTHTHNTAQNETYVYASYKQYRPTVVNIQQHLDTSFWRAIDLCFASGHYVDVMLCTLLRTLDTSSVHERALCKLHELGRSNVCSNKTKSLHGKAQVSPS